MEQDFKLSEEKRRALQSSGWKRCLFPYREYIAELFGSMILLAFGVGVVCSVVLSNDRTGGDFFSINIGWGLGVTLAIYAAGGISGAHLNPAVTIALAITKQLPWRKVSGYIIAQLAGAFLGAAIAFSAYHSAFDNFDKGSRQVNGEYATASIFFTRPASGISITGAFINEVIGSALLLFCIKSIGDQKNMAPKELGPLMVGFLVVAIGACFGWQSGYAINPARDLGPRLFTLVAGWGWEVFSVDNFYFLVPIVAPLLGGVMGSLLYELFLQYE
jgi:MIP family channel proteins